MQDIATTKSEIAALMTKVNDYSGNNISQQLEFRSYLKQADKVYGQPVEPPKKPSPQEIIKAAEENQQPGLKEKSKDNSREYAKPVEQKSSAHPADTATDDYSHTSGEKEAIDSESQKVKEQLSTKTKNTDSKPSTQEPDAKLQEATAQGHDEELAQAKTENSATEDALISAEQAKLAQNDAIADAEILAAGAVNGMNQTSQQLDELSTENGVVDEENLIDWLSLLEKSIAKATDKAEPSLNENGEIIESGNADKNLAALTESAGNSDVDSDLSLLDVLSQGENSELTYVSVTPDISLANTELDADNPEAILNLVQSQSKDGLTSEEISSLSTEQAAQASLETLTTLVTELQSALNASEQNNANGDAESVDELITRIGEFLQQLDPKVVDKLSETLSIESSGDAMANNMLSLEDTEAQNAVIEEMQLLLGMLNVANVSEGQSTATNNSDIQQDGKTILNTQTADIASNAAQEVSLTSKQIDKQLAALVDLPADKLDAALANLAQRLDIKPATGQVDTSEANLKTDFVNALKSGIEEVKAQIKQGHQPAIDLSALVSDAANKVNVMPIVPEVLDQSVTRFNQSLELTSQLNAKIEQLQHNFAAERNLVKENVNQAQHLQTKQGQQMAQFDKAVNITRNEGLQQLTEKVRWMANQNNLQAEIRLDPPDLGAMKVRLNMSGDTASVNIVVQSQQARDVLEQATPRLKELLEQQGIELGQSSVQQESSNNTQQDSEYVGTNQGDENMPGEETQVMEQRISNGRIGGIDYFV